MEHQLFVCCTPEVESGYLWNPWECTNGHFMINQPNYCFQSPQQIIFRKYSLLDGFTHDFVILPLLSNLKCSFEEEILGKWEKLDHIHKTNSKFFKDKSGFIFVILWLLSAEISIWKILTLRTWCTSRFEPNNMRPSQERFFWPCLWTLKLASKFFKFHVP